MFCQADNAPWFGILWLALAVSITITVIVNLTKSLFSRLVNLEFLLILLHLYDFGGHFSYFFFPQIQRVVIIITILIIIIMMMVCML